MVTRGYLPELSVTSNRLLQVAIATMMIAISGCGVAKGALDRKFSANDQTQHKSAGRGESGSIAFDLTTLQKDQNRPDAADVIELSYAKVCNEPKVPPKPEKTDSHSEGMDCVTGHFSIEVKKQNIAKIDGLMPGKYAFSAIAYSKKEETKRGETELDIKAGEVTRGSIVLRKSQGAGDVVIDIVDDSRLSSCREYNQLTAEPRNLMCQLGKFTCSYESRPVGSKTDILKLFNEESKCSEFEARLAILRQLCDGSFVYDRPIRCTHQEK